MWPSSGSPVVLATLGRLLRARVQWDLASVREPRLGSAFGTVVPWCPPSMCPCGHGDTGPAKNVTSGTYRPATGGGGANPRLRLPARSRAIPVRYGLRPPQNVDDCMVATGAVATRPRGALKGLVEGGPTSRHQGHGMRTSGDILGLVQKTCANGHTFEKTTDCPVCPTCDRSRTGSSSFPRIGAPATRALENAGVRSVAELPNWSERDLLALHGMGPKAVGILRERLASEGLTFKP
jgi:hypothetical protein